MSDNGEKNTPALQRGLTLLEIVASESRPLGFNELHQRLEISRSSLSRLLRVLRERGYLQKMPGTGKYAPGSKMALLGQSIPLVDRLRRQGEVILEDVRRVTSNTALLLYWTGREIQSLAKKIHVGAIAMQEVGSISTSLMDCPWGWIFYDTLGRQGQQAILHKHSPQMIALLKRRVKFYRTNGYTYDDQTVYEHVRRLAAPVRDADGDVVGALAVGGNPLTIPTSQVQTIGIQLVDLADLLSVRLGWSILPQDITGQSS